jgi:hypothetical protein
MSIDVFAPAPPRTQGPVDRVGAFSSTWQVASLLGLALISPGALSAQVTTPVEGGARPAGAPVAGAAERVIPAMRVTQGPEIDGVLDDPVWADAPVITDFIQQEPNEGEPGTERTEVRILHDGSNLYFGVHAFDSAPDQVVATEMRRDGNQILEEDSFQLILDTFKDSRSAYMFVVSPLGAQLDQQVADEGGRDRRSSGNAINRDWDGVWSASAERTSDGWVAEIAIPLVNLRFPEVEPQEWGINFMRNIARKNEQAFWAPIPVEFALTRVSLAGSLTGLESLSRGRDLRIKPYVSGGLRRQLDGGVTDNTTTSDIGLDLKYGVTASLNLDVTILTDFAQAEVDNEQVNLTRFPLFFPEKREFFLENAGQFTVGSTTSTGRIADLFFTRRIGITSEGNVPILGGARLTGKVGRNNIAVMDLQTDDAFGAEGENFLVTRYSRDVLERSQVGALFINKDSGEGHYNRTYAADMTLALTSALTVDGFVAATETAGLSGDNFGGHLRAGWLDQSWRIYAEHTDLEDNFNPEVGFVPRVGMRRTKAHMEFNPRPGILGIRMMDPMTYIMYITDQTGRLMSRQHHNMIGTYFQNGASFVIQYNRYFERLDDPFRVSGVTVPTGEYEFWDWQFRFNSNPARRITYNFGYSPQTFWGGELIEASAGLGVRVSSQLATSARFSRSDGDLPGGDFKADVGSMTLDYAFSPRMSLRSITQYNSSSDQWSTSARFRYIYRPGSDIYIVYDEVRRDLENLPTTPFVDEYNDRRLIVKMTYLLSM